MGLFRLWLAFSVLRFHTTALGSSWMPDGQAAVQAFFVLSGFAMAMVLDEKYQGDRRAFWAQRLLRLWPAYLAAFALVLGYESALWIGRGIGTGAVQEFVNGPRPSPSAWILLVSSNLSLLGQDLMALVGLDAAGAPHPLWRAGAGFPAMSYLVLPQAWSLSVELAFYALAPWYVRLGSRALVAVFLGGVLVRMGLIAAGLSANPWAYRFAPIEMSTFALGILAWRAFKTSRPEPRFFKSLAGWAAVIAAPLCARDPLAQSLALALATAAFLPWIFAGGAAWPLDRLLGEWAYPFYLLHHLVSYIGMDVAALLHVRPRFWLLAPACLAASALFWAALRPPLAGLKARGALLGP